MTTYQPIKIITLQAGIIEEMLEDTFEGMEDEDLEEAAQEEVDKVLFEVTKGMCKTFLSCLTESEISPQIKFVNEV